MVMSRTKSGAVGHGPLDDAILHVIARIESVLKEEQGVVSRFGFADLDALTARKSHLGLELGRLIEHAGDALKSDSIYQSVARLRRNLVANALLLQRHMEATGEISAILAEAIESASTDGMYSNQLGRVGPKSWSR